VERASVGLGPREGARLAAAFKALLNILALGLSPHGSIGIIETQVGELCRRFRKYKDGTAQGGGQRKRGTGEAAPTTATGSAASFPVAPASGATDAAKDCGGLISGAAATSVKGAEEKAVVAVAPTEPVRELTLTGLQATLEVAEAALREERSLLREERSKRQTEQERAAKAEAALEASEKERKELQKRLLQGMEARLEASEGRSQALRGALEARAASSSVGPDFEAVLSAAQASASGQTAAGGACCSV
jgi:hypothetical protein